MSLVRSGVSRAERSSCRLRDGVLYLPGIEHLDEASVPALLHIIPAPARQSSATERPEHAFARRRRLLELTAARLIVVRMLEDSPELVKEPEFTMRGGCFERG